MLRLTEFEILINTFPFSFVHLFARSETKESEGIVVGIREELKSLVEKETVLCEDDLNSTDFGELRREKVPKLELTNDQDPLNTGILIDLFI